MSEPKENSTTNPNLFQEYTDDGFAKIDSLAEFKLAKDVINNKPSQKQVIIPNKYNRECLVYGYSRKHHKLIPVDVLSLCMNLFGYDGFSWNIQATDLLYLGIGLSLKSSIFCFNELQFQLICKRPDPNSRGGFNFSSNYDTTQLHIFLNIIDPQLAKSIKLSRMVLSVSLYSEQLNMTVNTIVNTSFDFAVEQNISHQIKHALIHDQQLTPLVTEPVMISLNGTVDVLHIDYFDVDTNRLMVYHQNIFIPQFVEYQWHLSNSMKTTCLSPMTFDTYFSPTFGCDNWRLVFTDFDTYFNVKLQLRSLPVNIARIHAIWKCSITYNDFTVTNAKTIQFCVADNAFQNSSDSWNKKDFNCEIKDCKSLSVKIYIEIFKAERRKFTTLSRIHADDKYINDTSFNFSWGDESVPTLLSNNEMHKYGILLNNYENVVSKIDRNHLFLHKTVNNVKQHNDVSQFTLLTDKCPLYIDDSAKSIDENDTKEEDNKNDNAADLFDTGAANILSTERLWDNKVIDLKQNEIDLQPGFSFDAENYNEHEQNESNVIRDDANYKWIIKTLNKISNIDKCNQILNSFKKHQVTDERLEMLKESDWNMLIPQIGIRNEIRDLYKLKVNKCFKNGDCVVKFNSANEKEIEIYKWLDSIGFKMYFNNFIRNGFDSMDMIKEIKTELHLKLIGVQLLAHQMKLLKHITKLHI
eukprot:245925_1